MLSQRVGPERYYDMLRKFGLGQRTGVGLPGESAGLVPPIDQWSGSTFANLPIGQGLSMTLLQMTGMYQAIANDGVRVPHALSRPPSHPTAAEPKNRAPTTFAWCRRRPPRPCARCCVPWCNAIRWATSRVPGRRPGARLSDGRQDRYRAADQPWLRLLLRRRVLDHLRRNRHCRQSPLRDRHHVGQPGAQLRRRAWALGRPLFHNIAGWLMQRENVPLSPDPGPPLVLQAT